MQTLAEVAELVDALASGASGGNPVEVQVLSSVPLLFVSVQATDLWHRRALVCERIPQDHCRVPIRASRNNPDRDLKQL